MTVCFSIHSQNTSRITITSDQLRSANLIFAEHAQYSKLVPLLQEENTNLQLINESWERTDSIRTLQLYQSNQMIKQQSIELEQQAKAMERWKESFKISTAVGCSAVGVCILVTVLCLVPK